MSLLPERDAGGLASVAGPVRVLDALELGAGRLVVAVDQRGQLYAVPSAPVVDGPELVRARPGDGVAEALVALLHAGPGRIGGFEVVRWHSVPAIGESAVTVDQTNESVVVGAAAVVKWVVRPSREPHPAADRLELLASAGFEGMPVPWGLLRWHDAERPGSPPVLLATVASFVAGARDGWEWAVEDVRAVARGAVTGAAAVQPAVELGELTARLHLALATGGSRPATDAEASRWHRRAMADLDGALAGVDGPEGRRLAELAARARSALVPLADLAGTPVIAVHGDLHVGQVLRRPWPREYLVTDFDGSPVLSPSDRTAPAPAAVDVAGMLQSLDHVGRVVVHRTSGVDAAAVRAWTAVAQAAFLAAYTEVLSTGDGGNLLDPRALASFRVQQECREYLYAVRHLPHWRYVPDAALPDLLDELARTEG